MMTKGRRWKVAALLAVGMAVGVVMTATPASSHVGGTVAHVAGHMKAFFYTKNQSDGRYAKAKLPAGKLLTGNYAAWGSGPGYMGAAVAFRTPLPGAVAGSNAHFLASGAPFTAECPGYGKALAGHLCVYERQQGNRTLGGIYGSEGMIQPGASRNGFWIWYTVGDGGSWSYGEWAVRAPAAASRPASARASHAPAPPGD